MKCWIGLGSNLGDRRENLETAVDAIARISPAISPRVSMVYETPAWVPAGAPVTWNIPYLNAVVQIEWTGSAPDLLAGIKKIENQLGRTEAARWAPRVIDLDLLLFGNEVVCQSSLQIPHPGVLDRPFVLDPLKDLVSSIRIPGAATSVAAQARKTKGRSTAIMAILNLTPDSFSDGGENDDLGQLESKLLKVEKLGVQAIDLGAESTRPGALPVSVEEEKRRLRPVLEMLKSRYSKRWFRPYISVDTRNPEVAEMALDFGADCINDVSGLDDLAMLKLIADRQCDYVLMHSLGVPADPARTLPNDCDPVHELKRWLSIKLETIESEGVDPDRIIFDPGIGFGKTPQQSISILERIEEFSSLPIRLLVGHSRKSFLKTLGHADVKSRDDATLALSRLLSSKGVDILRIHDFERHVFRAG